MRVGIDIQNLRMDQRGIYIYICNLVEHLRRMDQLQLTLFLYGERWMDEPTLLERLTQTFRPAKVDHYWDVPSLHLLAHHFGSGSPPLAPRLIQEIDRRVLFPLWQFQVNRQPNGLAPTCRKGGFWHPQVPLPRLDVLHHTAGLLLPTANHANVLTIHDLISFHHPEKYPGVVRMFMDGYRHAADMDMILTYSEYTRRDVLKSLQIPDDQVRMIPLAAHEMYRRIPDLDRIRAVQVKYGLDKRPYFINIGFIEERKNHRRLIQAFRQFKQEELRCPHQLVLVGDGAKADMAELRAWIHERHLTPHVKCLGFVPSADLPVLLNGAEAFVFPSLYEGFGLPPLEAMKCGTPVIASTTTSVPEVVGDSGLLVDPLEVEEIAAAMRRLATNPGLRATLREKGLVRAQEFSWQKTAQATREAYEEAWRRFQRKSKDRQRRHYPTYYRKLMREYMIQDRAPLYVQLGVAIDMWPF